MRHNLGFPRIGTKRRLKFALEKYWRGDTSEDELLQRAADVRAANWRAQLEAGMDLVPVGDFSLYDHVLDMSVTLGHVPSRFAGDGSSLDRYFRMARGRSQRGAPAQALEMTKWFDTNYHYLVPELESSTTFALDPTRLLSQIDEARAVVAEHAGGTGTAGSHEHAGGTSTAGGHEHAGGTGTAGSHQHAAEPSHSERRDRAGGATPAVKPVILGPASYLYLAKAKGPEVDKLSFLAPLLTEYRKLLDALDEKNVEWVQIDEPILALDLTREWRGAIRLVYEVLKSSRAKLLLTTYFGELRENFDTVLALPVDGLHIDAVRGSEELDGVFAGFPRDKVLSVGAIDGRNVWKADLDAIVARLEPEYDVRGEKLWVAPSCSLLHVPVDLELESKLDPEIADWLAFAKQKLEEVDTVATALAEGRAAVAGELRANRRANERRRASGRTGDAAVGRRVHSIEPSMLRRHAPYSERRRKQREQLKLPDFPTTTIGSFPQTPEIRAARRAHRKGEMSREQYTEFLRGQIAHAIEQQEKIGIDVLVHGEAERNDMVEYFGEQLSGYAFTQHGWVQSFGSRCVKPPIIYGDVSRPAPMTVDWITHAQSLTDRPVKGMLTGPITMMQWAFVRDDQPRSTTAYQIALALRDEVSDLEGAGIRAIQVDEPALREGLPLRRSDWEPYLAYATEAFRIATAVARDETQIHTHMCYAEFNDIIESIALLDADVITIETSRSDMELLDAFTDFEYPNEIGPGVYDIHSPNVPEVEDMVRLMELAAARIPSERLWVNPDCGLKTRTWEEVIPSLRNMVEAAKRLREKSVRRGAA